MKRNVIKLLLWIYLLFVVIAYLSGCATTKPNTPFAGPYPQCFNELSAKNQLLANELAKLPEFQDGISNDENKALGKLVMLHNKSTSSFNKAFNEMYKTGLPDVRKYCSPLQAFFWLAEDGKIKLINEILESYSIDRLLYKAWEQGIKGDYLEISSDKIHEIAKNISGKEGTYVPDNVSTDVLKKIIIYNYFENPRIFTKNHKELMLKALNNKFNNRWNDFDTVIDRLNAPELLDYYINKNFSYKKNWVNSHTPKNTFLHNWGDCDDLAVFGKYILRKAGYQANIRYVYWTSDNRGHVGVVTKLEDGHYFIVVDFGGMSRSIMTGPYTNITEVDKKLSLGHAYHDSGWWQQPR